MSLVPHLYHKEEVVLQAGLWISSFHHHIPLNNSEAEIQERLCKRERGWLKKWHWAALAFQPFATQRHDLVYICAAQLMWPTKQNTAHQPCLQYMVTIPGKAAKRVYQATDMWPYTPGRLCSALWITASVDPHQPFSKSRPLSQSNRLHLIHLIHNPSLCLR